MQLQLFAHFFVEEFILAFSIPFPRFAIRTFRTGGIPGHMNMEEASNIVERRRDFHCCTCSLLFSPDLRELHRSVPLFL
jgi:hypothetical protein